MTTRRRFVALLGSALVGSSLLAGCLGNPPDPGGIHARAPVAANSAAAAKLETRTISLGFIPILEAAPLVVAVEKGFFAKHGLEVNLSKQASWPSARDNVVLGSAGGGIDGGQWQLPMPQMISEGALTNGRKVPMVILAMLMSQGNGIAAANSVRGAQLSANVQESATFSRTLRARRAVSSGRPTPSPRPIRTSGSATGSQPVASTPIGMWNC